jgi:hypothetical protein
MYHKGIPFAEHNFDPFQDIFFVIVLFESQCKTLFIEFLFSGLYLQICIFYFGISKYLNFTRELRRFDRKYTLDLPRHCAVKSRETGNVRNRF